MQSNTQSLRELTTKIIHAEIIQLFHQACFPEEFLNNMRVDSHEDMRQSATAFAVRVVFDMMGREIASHEAEKEIGESTETIGVITYPKTWWDGLKLSVLKKFGLHAKIDDWVEFEVRSVTYNKIKHVQQSVKHFHVCPIPADAYRRGGHISFLAGWEEPFTGTQREYQALTRIAEAALKGGMGGYGMNDELYGALHAYKREKAAATYSR